MRTEFTGRLMSKWERQILHTDTQTRQSNSSIDFDFCRARLPPPRGAPFWRKKSKWPPLLIAQSESLDQWFRHREASHGGVNMGRHVRSRRAAILADGGLFDSVAVWRPAEVGFSAQVRDLFRFQKEQFLVVYRKKMNDLVGTRPI